MSVFLIGVDPSVPTRSHPYDRAEYDSRVRYYDFVKNRHLIREVLEDYKPWERYEAIELFYQLLEWINGDETNFESSDCRMEAPQQDPSGQFPLTLRGRLMILFRKLQHNLADIKPDQTYLVSPQMKSLAIESRKSLSKALDGNLAIDLKIFFFPANYLLATNPNKFGHQIVFQFDCFGDSEVELFELLEELVKGISQTLKQQIIDSQENQVKEYGSTAYKALRFKKQRPAVCAYSKDGLYCFPYTRE